MQPLAARPTCPSAYAYDKQLMGKHSIRIRLRNFQKPPFYRESASDMQYCYDSVRLSNVRYSRGRPAGMYLSNNNNTNICKAHIVSIRAESEAPTFQQAGLEFREGHCTSNNNLNVF